MYWLVPLAPPPDKKYQFITLNLFLHLPNTCVEVSFWPFEQISVFFWKTSEKRRHAPALSQHQFSIARRQMLGSIIDNRIRKLEFLEIEKEQNGFEESCATRNMYRNWYTTWNWAIKQKTHVLLLFWPGESVRLDILWSKLVLPLKKIYVVEKIRWLKTFWKREKLPSDWLITAKQRSTHQSAFPGVILYLFCFSSFFWRVSLKKNKTKQIKNRWW